ncbi:MAG: hypothetical protein A2Y72_03610 [Chloroflexi bacterium RBG_13_53_26]|nr:MAG: hypothetical protein A2Y72_03610 [Chloroflexi bacterium RBG_13_53_26]
MAKVSNETRLIWNLAEERVARILRDEQAAHKKSRNYLKGLGAGATIYRDSLKEIISDLENSNGCHEKLNHGHKSKGVKP